MEITEDIFKEILAEQRTEFQHVVGILKEDLESRINLIAEHYHDIKAAQKTQTDATIIIHAPKLSYQVPVLLSAHSPPPLRKTQINSVG